MGTTLTRYWWALVLRGIVTALFGVAAVIWTGPVLLVLISLFGGYALADGILAVIAALGGVGRGRHWVTMLIGGILGILVGIGTFVLPGLTALSLVYVIAAWSVITGGTGIAAAIQRRGRTASDWLVGLSGLFSILFGLVLFILPGAGALSLVWVIGVYAVILGVALVAAGIRLHIRPVHTRREPVHAPMGA